MSFAELGLNPIVLKCLETTGYTDPTEVQRQAIPAALEGHDLLVSSHTGSGLAAAFLLPSLHKLAAPSLLPGADKSHGPRLLVLCPTRELALQVQKQAMIYGAGMRKLRTVCLVGGAPFGPQFQALKAHPEVMIATPGRLIDHIERGRIDFSRLEVLVLDEADRMLDMGFVEDIEHIVARTPASRQTLLFSATLDGQVGRIAAQMTQSPKRIEVATREEHKANIDQRLLFSDDIGHKHRLLDFLLRDVGVNQAVVFTATKASAEELCETLLEQGFAAAALHGDMPQHKRNRTLQKLRDGHVRILVATDVAARGIDVAGISHVINFDAPRQAEDYVHRIGRTGRAGRAGIAITLVHGKERHLVREIERYIGQPVRVEEIPGLEPKLRHDKDFGKKGRDFGRKPGGKPWGEKKPWGERKADGRKWEERPRRERPAEGHPAEHRPAGAWQGKPHWKEGKPEVRTDRSHAWGHGEKHAKPWDKSEGRRPESGQRPEGKSQEWAPQVPAGAKPRGRQSW